MASNIYSKYANKTATVAGKSAKPANVTFNTPVVHAATGGITLSWVESTEVDFKEYVVQLIPAGGAWETTLSSNTEIFRGRALKFLYTADTITPGAKHFLIKAVDTTANYSETAGSTSVTIAAPAWSGQTISHVINDGQITVTWPVPATTQFAIDSYEVRYRTGNSSTAWAGATESGHGTTEGVYSATNSITFPVTWGPGDEGSSTAYRTFIVKAQDTLGNFSSNEISKSVQIDPPSTLNVAHQFTSSTQGSKVDARVFWAEPSIGASQLPISHYRVYYKDWKTGGTAPDFDQAGSAYLEALGTTEFKQEVDWGPTKTNSNGAITSTSGTSNDIRRYWVAPVDLAGNWGIAYSIPESDFVPEIEDVTVTRPNTLAGLTASDYSTKSSNGVVEINWALPIVTTAPITSVRVFWELPTWNSTTSKLSATRGEKNSKAGTATKYSTPVTWGPTNGSGEVTRELNFVVYDSIGNISLPTGISVAVDNPAQISSTALTSHVIDNNVILRWTDPAATSLPIASYDIYRCPTGGLCTTTDYATTAVSITNVGGTNTYSFFETAAGDYKYFVRTKDLASNYSEPQAISTSVREPRDFVILADVDSKYNTGALTTGYCSGGTGANKAACESSPNIGDWIQPSKANWYNIEDESDTSAMTPIHTAETWESHFTGSCSNTQYITKSTCEGASPAGTWTARNWAGPSAQVTAGYQYYVVPETTATYWQSWDLGTEQATGTITLITTAQDHGPTTSDGQVVTGPPEIFICNVEADYERDVDDTTNWTSKGAGNNSVLGQVFRYVKVKIPYVSSNGAFKKISQQRLTLNLATIRDQSSSKVSVTNASTGKVINFNKTFQDITSIMVTPLLTGTCSAGGHTNRIACELDGGTWTHQAQQNTAIYDFNDVANPTSFTVYLMNAQSGAFVTGDFTWQATGV